jgi:hypothetical protein
MEDCMNTHLRFSLIPLALVLAATPALAHRQKGARNGIILQNHESISNGEQLPPAFRHGRGLRSHDQGGIILQNNMRAGGANGNGGIILQNNGRGGKAIKNRGGIILQNQNRGGIILQNQNRGGIILQNGQKGTTGSPG